MYAICYTSGSQLGALRIMDICIYLQSFIFFRSFELTINLINFIYAACYTSGSQLGALRIMDICIYLQSFIFFRGFELMIILTSFMYIYYISGSQLGINNRYLYLFTIFHFFSKL